MTLSQHFEERRTYYLTSWSGEGGHPSDRTILHPSERPPGALSAVYYKAESAHDGVPHTSLKAAASPVQRFPLFKNSGILQSSLRPLFPLSFWSIRSMVASSVLGFPRIGAYPLLSSVKTFFF